MNNRDRIRILAVFGILLFVLFPFFASDCAYNEAMSGNKDIAPEARALASADSVFAGIVAMLAVIGGAACTLITVSYRESSDKK